MSPDTDDSADSRATRRRASVLARAAGMCLLALLAVTAGPGCGGGEDGRQTSPDGGRDADVGTTPDVDADEDRDADEGSDGGHGSESIDPVLDPDGIAVTEAAVFVSPKHGGLDRVVAVESRQVSGVTDETPLLPEAQHVGGLTVEVSAGRNVDISAQEQGMYMILPVPASFDGEPSNLAVAKRAPEYLQVDPTSDGHLWSVQPGYYIPQARAFAFPLHYLMAEGSEFALVKSEQYDSRTLEFPNRDFGLDDGNATTEQGLYRTQRQPLFHKKVAKAVGDAVKSVADAIGEAFEKVGEEISDELKNAIEKVADTVEEAKKCIDNGGWKLRENFRIHCRSLDCSLEQKQKLRQAVKGAHEDFRPEFHKPDLTRSLPCRKIEVETSSGNETQWGRFYGFNLREHGVGPCSERHGRYLTLSNSAYTCFDGFGEGDVNERDTARHEYFHAVQFNYAPMSFPNFANRKSPENAFFPGWITEGTAVPAGNPATSATKVVRYNRGLRAVDVRLNKRGDDSPQYDVQDFWTYLVNARNSSPADTWVPLLKAQPGIPNKPTLNKARHLWDFEKHYWGWVRNQAFEARMTKGFGSALGRPCIPKTGNDGRKSAWKSLKTTLDYDPTKRSDPLRKTITVRNTGPFAPAAWKAEVAKIEVKNSSSSKRFQVSVSADGQGPVKLYRDPDSSHQNCWNRNEPRRESSLENRLGTGSEQTYYALMAKAEIREASFDLKVDHLGANGDKKPPKARIVKPAPGEEMAWDNATLEAEASDPGGTNFPLKYDWRVSHEGITVDDVNDNGDPAEDGNPVTLSKIPNKSGSYSEKVTIELTVTDDEGATVTTEHVHETMACRNLGEDCAEGADCCTGACGHSGGVAYCVGG